MNRLKTYSKVQRVVEYSTIFSDPLESNKRNISDDSIVPTKAARGKSRPNRNSAADLGQPLSSTLKNPGDDKRLVFKPFDSNVTESSHAKEDGSRISTRSSRKKAEEPVVRLFSSDAEDSDHADTLTENPATTAGMRGSRLKKAQSASDIEAKAPKLKSIMKRPAAKKVELKSKLKKQAALHLKETAAKEAPEPEAPQPVVSGKKEAPENDENKTKPTAAGGKRAAPRMLAIISDKDDLLKHVVCDNKTKYTTTTSTPQIRRRKLKVQEDLSIICKSDSPATPVSNN